MTTDPISDDALAELAEVEPCFNELARELARQLLASRQGEQRLREALEYIADPIAAARRKVAESKGELKLDGAWACRLAENANHLKDVASQALTGDAP